MMYIDPFASRLQDEPIPSQMDKQNSNISHDSMDPVNMSVGNSEPDVSGIEVKSIYQETVRGNESTSIKELIFDFFSLFSFFLKKT